MALNFKSCGQVDELKQSHCGDNLEGIVFKMIYIHIYMYIYILQKNKRKQKSGISTLKWLDFTYCSNKRALGIETRKEKQERFLPIYKMLLIR